MLAMRAYIPGVLIYDRERDKDVSTAYSGTTEQNLPVADLFVERSGLTTGSPLNHRTPSVAIRLIIDGKDVSCRRQREAGSLMFARG